MKNDSHNTCHRKSDIELVRMAQQGDADAFASLYEAHKAKVYSICLRMTCNTAEAEDLTQVAFLQVFRKLAAFRGDSALATWLYRIAINTALMHFRRKGARPLSLDEPLSHAAGSPKWEIGKNDDRLSGCVDRIALTRAMKELPAGYRTIFVLHEVQGYQHHEIASLLRCSIGTSKSQLHKAKARMRELLQLKILRKPLSQDQESQATATDTPNLPAGGLRPQTIAPDWGQVGEVASA